jgi:hypothetical protein
MSRIITLACVLAAALAGALLIVGSASANDLKGTSVTCTEVSGSFVDFVKVDHPIVWHVSVNGGAFQAMPTTETPPGFFGSGTATAEIFATWTGHTSPTLTESVTCAAPPTTTPTTTPPTTTIPVTVGGEIVNAPTAVVAAPSFTG